MAAQRIQDGTMFGIRLHHAPRRHQGPAAIQMQLLDQAIVLLLQAAIPGCVDDRLVEGQVGGVVAVQVAGRDSRLHRSDDGLQPSNQFGRGDRRDDPTGHREQGGTHVVDLRGRAVVDVADEDAPVGDPEDQPVPLDGAKRLAHWAAADAETGREFRLIETRALWDRAIDDQPRDLLGNQRRQRAATAKIQQAGRWRTHGWVTRLPMVERRLTRTMIAKVTSSSAIPSTAMAPRSPLSFRS